MRAARGAPSDAVVWEEVEARTSESTELGGHFLIFMVLACLIAAIGIYLESPILIIGGMVVGPEFGPLAGLCVAVVDRRRDVAWRSLTALAVGFPLAITAAFLFTLVADATGLLDDGFESSDTPLTDFISHPDAFSFIVAALAGTAGVLSLTSAKSGALIGVLISVTTILAAANIGIAAALGDWAEWRGAIAQLAVNLAAIVLAGVGTLQIQRASTGAAERRTAAKRLPPPACGASSSSCCLPSPAGPRSPLLAGAVNFGVALERRHALLRGDPGLADPQRMRPLRRARRAAARRSAGRRGVVTFRFSAAPGGAARSPPPPRPASPRRCRSRAASSTSSASRSAAARKTCGVCAAQSAAIERLSTTRALSSAMPVNSAVPPPA